MLAGSTLSTAIIALILGGVGIIFTVFNLYVAARNRRLDEEDKQDQRAAEQSYKYSKEVQVEPVVFASRGDGCPLWSLSAAPLPYIGLVACKQAEEALVVSFKLILVLMIWHHFGDMMHVNDQESKTKLHQLQGKAH
jgi:hypothetical protein